MSVSNKTPHTISSITDASSSHHGDPRHERLTSNPILWSSIGVTQTLLTAGIVFGWASLLPVLRDEGVDHTPQDFARVFTCGAVGNYVSTLAFGVVLDHYGPKATSILASILFSLGCVLCCHNQSYLCLLVGFGLIGFSGPGIQMPTLHLANLFGGAGGGKEGTHTSEAGGGSGGSAIYMSSQAAAFDGGTAVFALVRTFHQQFGLKTSTFFLLYLIIPVWVLLTALFAWPNDVLTNASSQSNPGSSSASAEMKSPYVGPGSPYLSPGMMHLRDKKKNTTTLYDAPLSVILRHSSFWTLAVWVSIHILKLNFVVATINDQLDDVYSMDEAETLIGAFGAMLPFGFIILPVVAWLLQTSATWSFQFANTVGLLYGVILVYFSSSSWLLKWFVFPAVATSRQMVYSTIFHQIGVTFGFANYGVLLGLTNIMVSAFSLLQNPLVNWSEIQGDYTSANTVLFLMTLPLFAAGLVADSGHHDKNAAKSVSNKVSMNSVTDEETPLFRMKHKARSNSESYL